MTIRRASLGLSICASLALGSAAVAAPASPPPVSVALAPAGPVKITDIGCTAQLLWFINAGRELAKDATRPEKDRVSMFQTVELMRGALGYFEARIDALPPADRSSLFVQEVGLNEKMTPEERSAHVSACLTAFTTAEKRVLSSLDPKK